MQIEKDSIEVVEEVEEEELGVEGEGELYTVELE